MPHIDISVLQGRLTEDQIQELIERVSNVVAEIEARPHPPERLLPGVVCLVREVPPAHWGSGGKTWTLDRFEHALANDELNH